METIKIEREGNTAIMLMDRPPVNSIDLGLLREAEEVLSLLEDDDGITAVVITGTGSCFSAGLDLKVVPQYNKAEQIEMIEIVNRVITRIYGFAKPTVAAVNGHALAGGFILAISCDYRIGASGSYNLGVTEARVGIPFPIATIEVLKAELHPAAARRMILTGIIEGPDTMLANGFLDEIQPPGQLLPRAKEVAADLGSLPRLAHNRIKQELRGDTITRIESVMNSGDPLLDTWITDESKAGATRLLDLGNGTPS